MDIKNYKVYFVFVGIVIVMVLGVVFWNNIINKKEEETNNPNYVDVSNANNVPYVDSKLGSDMKITQGYLLNYVVKKRGTWYMSKAYVVSVKKVDDDAIIRLSSSKDSDNYLDTYIDYSKCNIKKGDTVYFVGNVDIETNRIRLSKISLDTIDYKSVTEIDLDALIENIELIKSTYFIISGYMVTDNDVYKLFDNKEEYQKNNNAGNYFTLEWKGDFGYTGNQNVKVKCLLESTYRLKDCELQK